MSEPTTHRRDEGPSPSEADHADVESLLAHSSRPDPAAIARVRERVLADYGEALAAGAFLAPRHQAIHARRYLARVGLAMGTALAVVTLVAASHDRPGEPFYPFRIAFEEFTLPSGDARWPAQLQLLQTRWTEVTAAAQAGDPVALQAAWTAYQADLGDLVSAGDQPGADPAALQQVLDVHAASLSATSEASGPVASFEATVLAPAVQDHQDVTAAAGRAPRPTAGPTSTPASAATPPPASTPTTGPAASHGNGNGNGNGNNGNGNGNGGGNGNGNNGNGNGNGGGNGNGNNGNGNGNGGGNGNGNGNGHGHK